MKSDEPLLLDQRPTSVLCPRDLDALTDPLYPTRTQVGCTLSRHSVACSTEPVRHKRNGTARQLAGQTRHCPWLMDLAFLPDTDTTDTTPTPLTRHRTTSREDRSSVTRRVLDKGPAKGDTGAPAEAIGSMEKEGTQERGTRWQGGQSVSPVPRSPIQRTPPSPGPASFSWPAKGRSARNWHCGIAGPCQVVFLSQRLQGPKMSRDSG